MKYCTIYCPDNNLEKSYSNRSSLMVTLGLDPILWRKSFEFSANLIWFLVNRHLPILKPFCMTNPQVRKCLPSIGNLINNEAFWMDKNQTLKVNSFVKDFVSNYWLKHHWYMILYFPWWSVTLQTIRLNIQWFMTRKYIVSKMGVPSTCWFYWR